MKMLPLVATKDQMDEMVHRIIAVWEQATEDQATRGRSWYRTANDLATLMAEGNTVAGAGVIAALSPQTAWEWNVRNAQQAFENGFPAGHTGNALRKAARIMAGENPLDVLPADSKTWNFFRCIVDPDDAEAVVIDRHAHDIVAGERYEGRDRGLSTKRRYALVALAYRNAANYLNELPSTVQAVTWVVWREQEK